MRYPRTESTDARLLVRSLGLLLNQVAVYGPVHNVTKTAIQRVYEEVYEKLNRYGVLEFTVKNNLICVNGFSEDLDSSVSSNLVRRFSQLDIAGLLFTRPVSERDFERSIKILARPAAVITKDSGVEALLTAEGVRSVSVVSVAYRRVEEDAEDIDEAETRSGTAVREVSAAATEDGVFDLSAELMGEAESDLLPFDAGLRDEEKRSAEKEKRKKQSSKLAELLRQTAELLEGNSENPKDELGRVVEALETVRTTLLEMSSDSQIAISSFARDVDEDKDTVAGLEAYARRRGFSLKLTREDLLDRYAELNQEIIQPLTVSSGVIEMLRKQQAGAVSETQDELLKMAFESIERVNELVSYVHTIAGLPDSFTPDSSVINDSYISRH
ncbi:MAG: hypothetical protein R6V06_08495 [Kiritimatiellia bacterium]